MSGHEAGKKEKLSVQRTLLAVDDSATMRKVFEITFAGSEFRLVVAETPEAFLDKVRSEKPDLVLTDASLEPSGYDLCRTVKEIAPETRVVIVSSKQNPYDPARGSMVSADDYLDKPFDTQQAIDKIRKLLTGGEAAKPAVLAQAAPATVTPQVQAASVPAPTPVEAPQASAPPPAPSSTSGAPPPRGKTLVFGQPPAAPPSASGRSVPAPPSSAASRPPQTGTALSVEINGMASKLSELGLTPAQADAVLALSRDVVERVVWEVVPVLAETLIKEEIARLTK